MTTDQPKRDRGTSSTNHATNLPDVLVVGPPDARSLPGPEHRLRSGATSLAEALLLGILPTGSFLGIVARLLDETCWDERLGTWIDAELQGHRNRLLELARQVDQNVLVALRSKGAALIDAMMNVHRSMDEMVEGLPPHAWPECDCECDGCGQPLLDAELDEISGECNDHDACSCDAPVDPAPVHDLEALTIDLGRLSAFYLVSAQLPSSRYREFLGGLEEAPVGELDLLSLHAQLEDPPRRPSYGAPVAEDESLAGPVYRHSTPSGASRARRRNTPRNWWMKFTEEDA